MQLFILASQKWNNYLGNQVLCTMKQFLKQHFYRIFQIIFHIRIVSTCTDDPWGGRPTVRFTFVGGLGVNVSRSKRDVKILEFGWRNLQILQRLIG